MVNATNEVTGALVLAALCAPIVQPKKVKMGRPYYAARVLMEAGGANAVIDEKLADKVCESCGKRNKTESMAWLKIAQQMCSGVLDAQAEMK